jgi:hypothetical protein
MNWQELDVDLQPGHYHFPAQAPRLPMRFRRAAVMRGYDSDMGALGAGDVTLTIRARSGAAGALTADDDLPHFDVTDDGTAVPRGSGAN